MPIQLTGDYTTAQVLVEDESLIEDNCLDQIRMLIDHPAFTEPIRMIVCCMVGEWSVIGCRKHDFFIQTGG
jgi:hypothetical protein